MTDETKIPIQKVESQDTTAERTRQHPVLIPRVDIIERQDALYLVADMPGADEETIDINVEKNVLTVAGRMTPRVPEGFRQLFEEFDQGDYLRSFTLSNEIDQTEIEATMKDGVLRLTLPKAKETVPRRIKVKVE